MFAGRGTLLALPGLFAFPTEDVIKAHPGIGVERGKGGANTEVGRSTVATHVTAVIAGTPFASRIFEEQLFHFRPLSCVTEFLSRGFFVPIINADFPVTHP